MVNNTYPRVYFILWQNIILYREYPNATKLYLIRNEKIIVLLNFTHKPTSNFTVFFNILLIDGVLDF